MAMMRMLYGVAIVAMIGVLASANVCTDAVNSASAEVRVRCFPIDTVLGDRVANGCIRTQQSTGDIKIIFKGMNGFDVSRIEAKVAGTRWLLGRRPLVVSKDAAETGALVLRNPTSVKFSVGHIPSNSDGCCNDLLWFEFNIVATDGVEPYEATRSIVNRLTCSEQCTLPGILDIGKCLPNEAGVCKGCYALSPIECYSPAGDILNQYTNSRSCRLPNGRMGMYKRPDNGSLACECVEIWSGSCFDKPEENSLVNQCTMPDGKFGRVTDILPIYCPCTTYGCSECDNYYAPPQCECAPIADDECLDTNVYPNPITKATGGACIYDGINGVYGMTTGKLANNQCICGAMPDDKCYDRFPSGQPAQIMNLGEVCADYWFVDYNQDPGSAVYTRDNYRKRCDCAFSNYY